jgi:hypothetical protein
MGLYNYGGFASTHLPFASSPSFVQIGLSCTGL